MRDVTSRRAWFGRCLVAAALLMVGTAASAAAADVKAGDAGDVAPSARDVTDPGALSWVP